MAWQVQLYIPEFGHPAFGIVRAIVKDSYDTYRGLPSVTFLDSSGQVSMPHADLAILLTMTSALLLMTWPFPAGDSSA